MARAFVIPGETMVKVLGGGHNSGTLIFRSGMGMTSYNLVELGLATEEIKITPKFHRREVHIDDYGPEVPAEIMWMLAEVNISMKLIHFDQNILSVCLKNSMGGATANAFPQGIIRGGDADGGRRIGLSWGGGVMKPAGSFMGNYKPLTYSGNYYLTLGLQCEQFPESMRYWRFFATYIDDVFEYPVGTERSIVELNWRCIPYPVRLTYIINSGPGALGNIGLFISGTNTSGTTFNPGTISQSGELMSSGVALWDNPQNIVGPDPQFPFYNG